MGKKIIFEALSNAFAHEYIGSPYTFGFFINNFGKNTLLLKSLFVNKRRIIRSEKSVYIWEGLRTRQKSPKYSFRF